jgi:hypothetical protein
MGVWDWWSEAVTNDNQAEEDYRARKEGESDASAKLTSLVSGDPQGLLFSNFAKIVAGGKGGDYKSILYHHAAPNEACNALVSQLANPSVIGEFIEATPAMLGILTPRIEFYKVVNGDKGLESKEVIFNDHVSGERMAQLGRARAGQGLKDADGFDEILNKQKLPTDVGIKEFTWMFDNKHDGDKTLKASLTIFFGSVLELMTDDYYSFIFNMNTPEDKTKNKKDLSVALTDVVKRFNEMKDKKLTEFPAAAPRDKAKGFRQIKARVGWSRPERNSAERVLANFSEDKLKEFYDAVESTQKTILLNLTQYKINFGQEGQVELVIDYVGSLDSVISDPDLTNIFTRTIDAKRNSQLIIPRQSTIAKEGIISAWTPFYESIDKTNELTEKAFGMLGTGKVGSQTKLIGSLAKQLAFEPQPARFGAPGFISNLAALQYEEKTLIMTRQYLVELGLEKSSKNQKQIKKVDEGLDAVRQAIGEANKMLVQDMYSQFYRSFAQAGRLRYVTVEESSDELIVKPGGSISGMSGEEDTRLAGNAAKKFNSQMQQKRKIEQGLEEEAKDKDKEDDDTTVVSIGKDGVYKLLYVTVGDILEIASTTEANEPFTILKDLDAEVLLGSFNGQDAGITKNKTNYSIADIPISMETFGQWFLENFSGGSPPRFKISFRLFLNKLMNNLVAPMMNQYLADAESSAKANFSMATISFPRGAPKLRKANSGGKVTTEAIETLSNSAIAPSDPKLPTTSYLIVFGTMGDSGKYHGDRAEDQKKGIFHLTLGSDKGIVKTFSFSEKKIPYLRAMNIENASKGSALVLPQDVVLTMVGNTFFRNGSIIYVNAGFALGDGLSKKLGIGGYYTVVKSENTINSSRFETRLTCMTLEMGGE